MGQGELVEPNIEDTRGADCLAGWFIHPEKIPRRGLFCHEHDGSSVC